MPVTESYEPIRPIYVPDDGSVYTSPVVLRADPRSLDSATRV